MLSTPSDPSRPLRSSVRPRTGWLVLGAGILLAAGCGVLAGAGGDSAAPAAQTTGQPIGTVTPATQTPTTAEVTTTTAQPTTTTTIDPVDLLIAEITASMPLQDKIGQMLMPVIRGTGTEALSVADRAYNSGLGGFETPAELIAAYRLGGLMYLGPNVESPGQIATFSADLQTVSAEAGLPPLFIAADQEGGRVRRIRGAGVTDIGSARSLAGDADAVFNAGATTGTEMKALGINVVFAPVADVVRSDVGVIGNRSYGSDPVAVGEMVTASIDGLQLAGVAAVAKHWPGHGATEVDSHQALPTVSSSAAEWAEMDLPPFQRAVEADVDAMMVGHLAVPSLDPAGTPATISAVLTDQMVRADLGYEGVLFTDAMDMRALDGIAEDELAVLVIEAGIDILLVPPDLSAAIAGITAAVASGRLTEERIDESLARILRMKADLGLLSP